MSDGYPGRRLRCSECSERLVADGTQYGHARECGGTVGYPYYPDRMDTERTTLEDYTDV